MQPVVVILCKTELMNIFFFMAQYYQVPHRMQKTQLYPDPKCKFLYGIA